MGDGKKYDMWKEVKDSGYGGVWDRQKLSPIEADWVRPAKTYARCEIEIMAMEMCRLHNTDSTVGPRGYLCRKEMQDMFECVNRAKQGKLEKRLLHASAMQNDPIHSMQGFHWRY